MKLVALFVSAAMLFAGCSGLQVNPHNEQVALIGMQMVAYNVGYYVATKQPTADPLIRQAYTVARTGQLSPETLAQGLSELKVTDPLLLGNCLIALRAMGASMSPDGQQVIAISGISPATWEAAATGYLQGIELGKLKR